MEEYYDSNPTIKKQLNIKYWPRAPYKIGIDGYYYCSTEEVVNYIIKHNLQEYYPEILEKYNKEKAWLSHHAFLFYILYINMYSCNELILNRIIMNYNDLEHYLKRGKIGMLHNYKAILIRTKENSVFIWTIDNIIIL